MLPKTIAALGDSITQGYIDNMGIGWFGRLSIKASEKQVLGFHNISMAGDRICDAWHRFSSQFATMEINTIIISIGCNDVARRGFIDAQLDISKELRALYWDWLLIDAKLNIENVVVLDILPVHQGIAGEKDIYVLNKDIEEYNKQIENICFEKNIHFIKRYDKWLKRDLSKYYADNLHPNGAGHQLIADEVFEELKKLGILE